MPGALPGHETGRGDDYMISALKGLLAGPETAARAVNAIIDSGDALIFTDEEKAEAKRGLLAGVSDYMRATSGSARARRLVAVMVTGVWALFVVIAGLVWPFMPDWSGYLVGLLNDAVMPVFLLIAAFYFAVAGINGWKKKP